MNSENSSNHSVSRPPAAIGIFDSGLGGLLIAEAIVAKLPEYDYIYFGDTAHLPYGSRDQEEIYELACRGIDRLYDLGARLIIVACNTISAKALRRLQRTYMPAKYPDCRLLGVIVPAIEEIAALNMDTDRRHDCLRIAVLATPSTIDSGAFEREISKLSPSAKVINVPAPDLAELIEQGRDKAARDELSRLLRPILNEVDALIVGCTHYLALKPDIKEIMGTNVRIIAQDESVPIALVDYLARHSEIAHLLSRQSRRTYYVSALTPAASRYADQVNVELVLDPNNE